MQACKHRASSASVRSSGSRSSPIRATSSGIAGVGTGWSPTTVGDSCTGEDGSPSDCQRWSLQPAASEARSTWTIQSWPSCPHRSAAPIRVHAATRRARPRRCAGLPHGRTARSRPVGRPAAHGEPGPAAEFGLLVVHHRVDRTRRAAAILQAWASQAYGRRGPAGACPAHGRGRTRPTAASRSHQWRRHRLRRRHRRDARVSAYRPTRSTATATQLARRAMSGAGVALTEALADLGERPDH